MAEAFNRVSIQGSLVGGEIWSVGFAFQADEVTTPPVNTFEELQAWADEILTLNAGKVLPPGLLSLISSSASITKIRTEAYDIDGSLGAVAEAIPAAAINGTSEVVVPFQTALVASLLSGRPGRSRNGRVYWPALAASINSTTGRLDNTQTASYANLTGQLITAIAGAAPTGADLFPIVFSQKLALGTEITTVRVGDVLDTQRRRRDSLVEVYSSVTL